MAFTLKLAETFLAKLIPPAVMELIRPYLDCSENVLESLDKPGYATWADKVRILPRTQPLIPADVDTDVIKVIYEALLDGRQFRGRYKRGDGDVAEYDLHPLGLVFRESVVYLVATVWDYPDPRHYALHRFVQCEILDATLSMPDGFNLDKYLSKGTFEYADVEGKEIKLTAIFTEEAAHHLRETPLSRDQKVTHKRDGRIQVTATVKDSRQLRWWLLGFGSQVEVVRPQQLREGFREVCEEMSAIYNSG